MRKVVVALLSPVVIMGCAKENKIAWKDEPPALPATDVDQKVQSCHFKKQTAIYSGNASGDITTVFCLTPE